MADGASSPTNRRRRGPRPLPLVLIADDTSQVLDLYAAHFGARGFRVATAHDGATAVDAALELAPDVIVMDLAMPQIDGVTAIRRIRAAERARRAWVILLTGYPGAAVKKRHSRRASIAS